MATAKAHQRPSLDEFVRSLCPGIHREVGEPPYHCGDFLDGPHALAELLPDGFEERTEWADGLERRIWVSRTHRSIVTCCGTLLTVERFERKDSFEAQLRVCEEFYR
ncbi:MAG: hypothetical protein AB7O52_12360 [Planctomycetota bacterium]